MSQLKEAATSGNGPKRRLPRDRNTSEIGGKADVPGADVAGVPICDIDGLVTLRR